MKKRKLENENNKENIDFYETYEKKFHTITSTLPSDVF